MSNVTFSEFNQICPLLDPEKQNGEFYGQFTGCILKIRQGFQYPQYYNGLIALLLLFSHDETYILTDQNRITSIFQEIKELAIMGYENFEDFRIDSLDKLIMTLRQMSNIFTKLHSDKLLVKDKAEEKGFEYTDYFINDNGVETQIKLLDCSKSITKKTVVFRLGDIYQEIPMKEKLDCDERILLTLEQFETAFASNTSGFILKTVIGKVK